MPAREEPVAVIERSHRRDKFLNQVYSLLKVVIDRRLRAEYHSRDNHRKQTDERVFIEVAFLYYYLKLSTLFEGERPCKETNFFFDSCMRVFGSLQYLDPERALWSWFRRPREGDQTFAALLALARDSNKDIRKFARGEIEGATPAAASTSGLPLNEERADGQITIHDLQWAEATQRKMTEVYGYHLWRITLHMPHNLTPTVPPPPYTLHAFNIELPSIEWPSVKDDSPRLWRTATTTRSQRPHVESEADRRAIVSNLLLLSARSPATVEVAHESRIYELSEDEEVEGGEQFKIRDGGLHGDNKADNTDDEQDHEEGGVRLSDCDDDLAELPTAASGSQQ